MSGPPAGLSALGPYLAERGFNARLLDLNVELFWHVWRNWTRLEGLIGESLARLAQRFDAESFSFRRVHQHLRVTLPLLTRMRRECPPDHSSWDTATARLSQRGLADVINAYFLGQLFLDGERLTVPMQELSFRMAGKAEDPLLQELLDRYDWSRVGVVGFSLLTESQLPYAMLISQVLRSRVHNLRSVVGGSYVTEVVEGLCSAAETFKYFDFVVIHEGESAIVELVEQRKKDCRHPNIIGRSAVRMGDSFVVEDIQTLPDQDFSQFYLDLYRPWGLGLPLYSSKGCTWARCAFCSVNFLRYRERDASSFFQSALRAVDRTGVKTILLVDEDVRPRRLARFAELAQSTLGSGIRWMIQTRFYPEFDLGLLRQLAQTGFSTIEFGLESSNQETLGKIDKGISIADARRILGDCEEAGIKVVLNFMIGFPWETERDAAVNLDFVSGIIQWHPKLDLVCNTQGVKIYVHSKFHRSPGRYGVKSSRPLALSPVTTWEPPVWVADFIRCHREHPFFTGRSLRKSIDGRTSELSSLDPHLSLAPEWYYLPASAESFPIADWAGPLLVRASDRDCRVLAVNDTLSAAVSIVDRGCRLSELKACYRNHFPSAEESETLSALGNAIVKLNDMGALAFHGD